jgi:hypothetical protein
MVHEFSNLALHTTTEAVEFLERVCLLTFACLLQDAFMPMRSHTSSGLLASHATTEERTSLTVRPVKDEREDWLSMLVLSLPA